jgi:two-component sensor histidine kinase
VTVTWSVRETVGGEPRLAFSWRESGGPPIEIEPVERVGSSVIRGLVKSELRGRAELKYPRTGAEHEFEFVLHDDSVDRLQDAPSTSVEHQPP